jgi:hypothetical protein
MKGQHMSEDVHDLKAAIARIRKLVEESEARLKQTEAMFRSTLQLRAASQRLLAMKPVRASAARSLPTSGNCKA